MKTFLAEAEENLTHEDRPLSHAQCVAIADELDNLRADRDNATRVVTELTAEVERLRAEEASLKILWRNANAACHELAAERDSLKAQLAALQQEGAESRARLEARLDEHRTIKAQLAEAQKEVDRQLGCAAQDATTIHGLREQLRVAREALETTAKCLSTPNPGITDTIWLDPDGSSAGPTLYEFICGRLAALSEISTKR